MKRSLILLLSIILIGCKARKVDIVKNDTKITIDSTSIVKTDSTSTINNNIKIEENYEELEIKPLVDTIPIIINGKQYKNVVLRYKKQKKVIVDTSKKITSKNSLKKVLIKKQKIEHTKHKQIQSKNTYWFFLIILLVIWLLWRYKFDIAFWLKEKLRF